MANYLSFCLSVGLSVMPYGSIVHPQAGLYNCCLALHTSYQQGLRCVTDNWNAHTHKHALLVITIIRLQNDAVPLHLYVMFHLSFRSACPPSPRLSISVPVLLPVTLDLPVYIYNTAERGEGMYLQFMFVFLLMSPVIRVPPVCDTNLMFPHKYE